MRCALAVLLVLLTSSASSAEAQRTNLGVLTCTLVKGAEARPGDMTCGFKPAGVGQEEKFTGHVRGAQQEERGKLVLIWTVFGPSEGKASWAMLAQKYARAPTADSQPPAWIGQSTPTVALQFETNSAHVDASISEIELKLAGTAA